MKILIAVAALVAVTVTLGFTFKRPVPQTWEYKLEFKMDEQKANRLGAEGWELAAIESTSTAGIAKNVPTYVFKRPKQ